ncbi:MAG: rRNA maturation RNase YbeY [Rhizobiales bacterium 65-9]|nr:rRNA maturation RNase YbeY [Hyphomicrobiales bacterium]OJY37386.1 MAG: rRNA maturation RNase YbeY [Rhizobiales bacterium 65-9]
MARVAIAREAPGWRAVARAEAVVRTAADAALKGAGVAVRRDAEISVLLTDDAAIRDLNLRWRGKDKATNVLSFPAAAPADLAAARALGDIVVALETVLAEARDEGKTPADHLAHLIVHGVLHLVGYDHEDDDEANEMEALETRILADLSIADPYAVGEAAS